MKSNSFYLTSVEIGWLRSRRYVTVTGGWPVAWAAFVAKSKVGYLSIETSD